MGLYLNSEDVQQSSARPLLLKINQHYGPNRKEDNRVKG